MSIICGTDFSTHAEQALQTSGALAKVFGLPVKLVHVIDDTAPLLVPPLPEANYEPLRARLRALAEGLAKRFGVRVEPLALHGVPHAVLSELARDAGTKLIVVSALGRTNHPHWLLGSVAERVSQTSPVPVFVARDASSIEAWSRGERPLKVTVGVDLGATSKAALRWVEQLRWLMPCDVRITQIAWPPGEYGRFAVDRPVPFGDLGPGIQALLERDLRAWAGALEGEGQTTFVVSSGWGRVDAHLTSVSADAQSDLLAIGTHQHRLTARLWQGSVSRSVIHYASSNVVCVPVSAVSLEEPPIAKIRSVLIPTDFSSLANQAIAIGYGLLSTGGVAHLLHVTAPDAEEDGGDLPARLRALIPKDAPARGISTEVHLVSDRPAWVGIWHAAGRLGVDAVCMSTHGRSGASRVVLGSQAQELLRRVRQPLVLVKSGPP